MKNRIIEIGVKEGISSRAHGFSDGHHNHELYGMRTYYALRSAANYKNPPAGCAEGFFFLT